MERDVARKSPCVARHVAVVCPGHGGEHDRMRSRVAARLPGLLVLAERLLGCDPFEHMREGTAYVQPAIYCASLAGWETIRGEIDPIAVSGHSLGEFAAIAIGGAISVEDGLRMVALRGRACQRAADAQPGGMLILKADSGRAAQLAIEYGLVVSGDNAPMQVVLSGPEDKLAALEHHARRLRLPVTRLRTRVPFHTEAMRSAAEELGRALSSLDVSPPRFPVLSAMTAKPFLDIRAELASALLRPVRWRATTIALGELGATHFIETGPGRILTGLIRRTLEGDATASSLEERCAGHAEPGSDVSQTVPARRYGRAGHTAGDRSPG